MVAQADFSADNANMCSPDESATDAVLAATAAIDPHQLDGGALLRAVADLSAFIGRLNGELARLTGVLDRRGDVAADGYTSAGAFLRAACGLSAGHAGQLVAVARALRNLPATADALAAGIVSFDKAHVIARTVADIEDPVAVRTGEGVLLEVSDRLDVGLLRQLGEELAYRAEPDKAEERERRRWEKRHLSFGLTVDDIGALHGVCGDAVSTEIVRTAAEKFGAPGGELDVRSAAQRRMDGLVAACKVALDTGVGTTRHTSAPHVTVLVRDETLARAGHAPPARTGHGTMLTATQALALCCGAQLTAIRWRDGLPLAVGRAARTEPPGLRRALESRDRNCRWPGCDALGGWCTAHHIGGWHNGARTDIASLVLLCHMHHAHFVHQAGWTITGSPNATLTFHDPHRRIRLDSPLPGMARAP